MLWALRKLKSVGTESIIHAFFISFNERGHANFRFLSSKEPRAPARGNHFKFLFFFLLHSGHFFKDFFQIFQFPPVAGPIAMTQIIFGFIIVVQRRRAALG